MLCNIFIIVLEGIVAERTLDLSWHDIDKLRALVKVIIDVEGFGLSCHSRVAAVLTQRPVTIVQAHLDTIESIFSDELGTGSLCLVA